MASVVRLSEDDVLFIRRRMARMNIADIGAFGHIEPLDYGKFASAVSRHSTSGGGRYKYTSIPDIAANLFYGIAMGHSFENGNKRTALVSMLVFLDRNKTLLVDTAEDELYEMARRVAAHEIVQSPHDMHDADDECRAIAEWLSPRLRSLKLGDKALEFKELREILEAYGCTFESPNKNFIKIRRGQWVVKTGYPRQKFDVQVNEIKRIRKALRLDEVHGTDSASFYDLEKGVSRFVNQYRNLLRRLADL